MKTKVFTLAALLCCASAMYAQESGYKFTTVASQKATPVKNQASTGTCWCFATTSFMESELLRMGKGEYDLSEMFIVRQKYLNPIGRQLLPGRQREFRTRKPFTHMEECFQPSGYRTRGSISRNQL